MEYDLGLYFAATPCLFIQSGLLQLLKSLSSSQECLPYLEMPSFSLSPAVKAVASKLWLTTLAPSPNLTSTSTANANPQSQTTNHHETQDPKSTHPSPSLYQRILLRHLHHILTLLLRPLKNFRMDKNPLSNHLRHNPGSTRKMSFSLNKIIKTSSRCINNYAR